MKWNIFLWLPWAEPARSTLESTDCSREPIRLGPSWRPVLPSVTGSAGLLRGQNVWPRACGGDARDGRHVKSAVGHRAAVAGTGTERRSITCVRKRPVDPDGRHVCSDRCRELLHHHHYEDVLNFRLYFPEHGHRCWVISQQTVLPRTCSSRCRCLQPDVPSCSTVLLRQPS